MWQKVGLDSHHGQQVEVCEPGKVCWECYCSLNQQQSCCRCHAQQHVRHQKWSKPVDSWWVSKQSSHQCGCHEMKQHEGKPVLSNSAVTKWHVKLRYDSWAKDDHKISSDTHVATMIVSYFLLFSYILAIKVSEKFLSDERVYHGSTKAIRRIKPILLTMFECFIVDSN